MDARAIIKSKTFTQTAITSSATLINGLLGIMFYMFLARSLGPSEFGILSISITTLTLLADIANVGTDTGIVRFVGKYISKDRPKALRFLKLGLEVKIVAGLIIVALGWLVLPSVTVNILQKPSLTAPLQIALIGCFGAMLFSFAASGIQATQKFFHWSILTVSANALRLLLILFLSAATMLSLTTSLWAYVAIPFLGFIAALFILPKFLNIKEGFLVAGEFFHYNKWIAIFTIIAALSSRLDSYLSTRFLSLEQVGIYAVATGLAAIVPQIIFAIATVVAPKLASFDTHKVAIAYLKKLQLFVTTLAILGVVVGSAVAYVIIPLFYGQEYLPSISPFIILLIAQAIFLISIPAHTSVIYYFSNTKLFVPISIVQLLITFVLGWLLIPSMGYLGAALTVLIGNIFNFIAPSIWVIYKFSKK